jgi:hypothetical protein
MQILSTGRLSTLRTIAIPVVVSIIILVIVAGPA